MHQMGYTSCKADPDLWLKAVTRPEDNVLYYAYILCYVDDILCIHHDRRMEILSCMQFVLHAGQVGVFLLNNFALAEQLQNSERLNFVRKKKRRRPRKVRRWLHEDKVLCALNQIFFLVHEYLGSERSISFEVSAPTRLSLPGSHVQRKFRKRTTLRSKSSTLIGLLYAG